MRTVKFDSVMNEVGRNWLGDPTSVTYSSLQKERMADAITNAVAAGLEHCEWPEWIKVEERPFRPVWDSSSTYAAGTELYDSDADAYYRALTDNTNKRPSENVSDWEAVESLERYLPWTMPGYWPFSQVLGVYASDPAPGRAVSFQVFSDYRGIWVRNCELNTVWVSYVMLPPEYTSVAFSEEATYSLGDVRYFSDQRECCMALLDESGAAVWVPVPLPYFLKMYAVYQAASVLHDDPAQSGKFKALADAELERSYVVNVLRVAREPQRVKVTLI